MAFLAGKRILITGLLSNRSIAWGIAKACAREGAQLAFTYQNERFKDRVTEMAAELGSQQVYVCDVANDEDIAALFAALGSQWQSLDGLVHAIAFAPREAIAGDFRDRPSAMLTLSYLGADRVVPNYNTMGLAKASLEATVRYLASSVGPHGVRVNGISAGPIKTLAAAGISGFGKILKHVEENAPLRRNVSIDDVGNAAAFLLSELAGGITGEITYVDAGFNTVVGGMGVAGSDAT